MYRIIGDALQVNVTKFRREPFRRMRQTAVVERRWRHTIVQLEPSLFFIAALISGGYLLGH